MQLSPELQDFIQNHATDDTDKLLFSAARFPGIDMPFAVDQILARRQIREKLPLWYAHPSLVYPSRLAAEQCSSALTADYKSRLLRGITCCDLTGGLGVDAYYFSLRSSTVTYIERFPAYCEAARHNFSVLHAGNIRIINSDVREMADTLQADTFYIDPARRAGCNQRVFALADCEPDVVQLKPILLERARRLLIKVSPMADIEETLRLLPETIEVHVVAVKNECKELLFILEDERPASGETAIHAVNLHEKDALPVPFAFTLREEKDAQPAIAERMGAYLYEPHAALLKSGAFKLTASRYGLQKLHRHSHLYTSDSLRPDFPGRIFQTEEVLDFSGKLLKQLAAQIPQANITVRNFPLSVAELRKRSRIKDGGELYLFATTFAQENKILIKSRKLKV